MTLPLQREGHGNYEVPDDGDLLFLQQVAGGGGFGDGEMSWFFKPPIQGPDGRVPGGTLYYDGGAGTQDSLTNEYAYPPNFTGSRLEAWFAPRTAPADFGTAGNPGTVAPNSYLLPRADRERYGITYLTRAGYGYYRNGLVAATPGTTIP